METCRLRCTPTPKQSQFKDQTEDQIKDQIKGPTVLQFALAALGWRLVTKDWGWSWLGLGFGLRLGKVRVRVGVAVYDCDHAHSIRGIEHEADQM